jgi:hypothetical protein
MDDEAFSPLASLRTSAWLLLAGQVLYIAITQLHAGGDANDHHAIFDAYAHSENWTVVHLGQFAATAILLAGLTRLFLTLDTASWVSRLGVASAAATLALYGVLQAVDGVALKQAVTAWMNAPEAEKVSRFATAEAIRWVEWGLRSYQDVAMGLTLFLAAFAVARAAWLPRPVAYLMGASGVCYMVQGWVAATEGFSPVQSAAIVLGWLLSFAWMTWLVATTSRRQNRVD